MMTIEPNNISYRDKAARVVKKGTGYYRYIFQEYSAEYNHLMDSGLYKELTKKGLLIEHQEIEKDTNDPKVYKLLQPTQIPFQSYPFEWSYTQWRKAILAYLRINHISLKYGMILKDASPYNFCLNGGQAVMFDTSSFMFFKENDKWIAYRNFCEEFLSPVALMYYNGADWSKLTMANLRGMPLAFVSKQLPIKSWFNLTTLLNIHIHSKYSSHNLFENESIKKNKGFTLEKIKSLQKMIFNTASGWHNPYRYRGHWTSYYENDIESYEYLKEKEAIIRKWLEKLKPISVLDLGANTGKFSFIATEYAEKVIALESDNGCVDLIENQKIKKGIKNLYPALMELTHMTSNIGLLHKEIKSIDTRAQSEMVLALAIVHHLYFSNQLSFEQIIELIKSCSLKYVIVEFIPISDNKTQNLLQNKKIDFANYNEESFLKVLQNRFCVKEIAQIQDSKRKLFLLEKIK